MNSDENRTATSLVAKGLLTQAKLILAKQLEVQPIYKLSNPLMTIVFQIGHEVLSALSCTVAFSVLNSFFSICYEFEQDCV